VLPSTLDEPMEGQHPAVRQMRMGFQNDKPLPEALVRRAKRDQAASRGG